MSTELPLKNTSENEELTDENKSKEVSNSKTETIKWCSAMYISYFGNVDSTHQSFDITARFGYYRQLTQNEKLKYENITENTPFSPDFGLHINRFGTVSCDLDPWNYSPDSANDKFYYISEESAKEQKLGGLGLQRRWTLKATFIESMELRSFPFDVQHFQMTFRLQPTGKDEYKRKNPGKQIKFQFMPLNSEFAVRTTFFNLPGWDFVGIAVNGSKSTNTDNINTPDWEWYQIILRRSWLFYFWRVVFISSVISLMSVGVFFFTDNDVGDRFGFLSTTLLTVVAYQFVISQYLPVLNYLTLLDKYILFVVFFIVVICFEVVGIYLYYNDNEDDEIDTTYADYLFLVIDLILWIIVHLYFIIISIYYYNRETKKITQNKAQIDKGTIFVNASRYTIRNITDEDTKIKPIDWNNDDDVFPSYTLLYKDAIQS